MVREKKRKEVPPHTRSWALRPSATSLLTAAVSRDVSREKPGLVPLREKTGPQGEGGGAEGGGGGGGRLRGDLSQLLQDLESSSGEEEEREREKTHKHTLPSSSSASKKRKITSEEA